MKQLLSLALLTSSLALSAYGQAAAGPTKVGVINIQGAIIGTKEGQAAASALNKKTEPKRKELEGKQREIADLQETLRKGSNTMSDEQKQKLMRDIDQKTKSLNRDTEDAQADLEQDQQKVLQELGQKMMAVIDKYARDNGYTLILDVSSPQTPVLYVSSGFDITQDIIALYDKNAPGAAPSASPAPAAPRPAAPKPAAPKPAATPKKN